MQRYIDRLSSIEGYGRKILIKERFKHDDFVPMLEERGED